jgi:succinate dehydrogenase/fumarate reductase flavoprotein subunit
MTSAPFDVQTDVLVLGSGGSGLTAALRAREAGAKVLVLEKAQRIGGTTAMSGGILWVPNNPHMAALGVTDSREEALAYLDSLSLGVMDMTMAAAFVDNAPDMIRWLEAHSPLRFTVASGYPDYHPENPGGKPQGGRSLDPALFSFRRLGAWAGRIGGKQTDLHPQAPVVPLSLLESLGRQAVDAGTVAERRQQDVRGMGLALVGALVLGCIERNIPIHTGVRAKELIQQDGEITGVIAERDGNPWRIRARRGVILATGGFEWNPELVKSFLRGPLDGPASAPENEGDGLLMAMSLGAALGNMSEAWWMPTIRIPDDTIQGKALYRLCLMERTLPGSLIVNRKGRRFANEAANYNDIGRAFHTFDPTEFAFENNPAWLIFDNRFLREYPLAGYGPGAPKPRGLVRSGTDLRRLAAEIDVPGDALTQTVERFNTFAATGQDPDFHRGVSAYDGFNGDRTRTGAAATLGTCSEAPFHAIQLVAGALGTKGGPRTDVNGRVLHVTGRVIPGLYAVGNAMAGSTGMVYGGAGGTLGPALTFGWLAGADAAARLPGRND